MAYTFNGVTKRITLSSGTVTLDLLDLHSRWKDWMLLGNSGYAQAFRAVGGDIPAIPLYLFILNGWRIVPQAADHTLAVTNGVFGVEGGGDPFVDPAGSYKIRINRESPGIAIGYSTAGGSGASASEVWAYGTRTLTSGGAGGTAPTALENAAAVRTELSTELARVDVAVSSRLAAAGYTAPDNAPVLAAVAAIPTTPVLTSDSRLNNLDAAVSSRLSAASYVAPTTAAAIADAVGTRDVEGTISLDELLRVALAVLAGRSTGTGSATEQYLSVAGVPRVTASFDNDGNRTSVVLNGS
jgi:hypothetical protein